MNILIIEDEVQASQRLQKLITEIVPAANVIATIDTVKKSVQWLTANAQPDLLLMDIQLADGISFEIFEQCTITAPVIFTTAYDEFALKAFKVNSVDYILKPVDKDELTAAFNKLKIISSSQNVGDKVALENIGNAVQMLLRKYKTRFVIKVGEHLRTIEVKNIRYFFSQDKTSFCATDDNRNLILDYTMDQLEGLLDPTHFFRINRKYIVQAAAIQDIISYTNSRLKLILKGSADQDIVVARERVQEFKDWLDQ